MSTIKFKRHHCWWCYELFEEGEIKHYKSGWLCSKCEDYLRSREGDDYD